MARAWRGAPGVVRAWPAPTWCTKSRRPLYLRSLCTKSHAFLRPWPAPSWCTKSRRPLFFRFLCTKSHAFLRPWPAPTWCTKSRRPLYLRSLHQIPRVSSSVAGADLVHETPPVLVLPFPLHQVPRVFSPVAGGRGASPLASSCFFVLGHHALEHRRKVMHERLPPAFVHHFSSIIFSKGKN